MFTNHLIVSRICCRNFSPIPSKFRIELYVVLLFGYHTLNAHFHLFSFSNWTNSMDFHFHIFTSAIGKTYITSFHSHSIDIPRCLFVYSNFCMFHVRSTENYFNFRYFHFQSDHFCNHKSGAEFSSIDGANMYCVISCSEIIQIYPNLRKIPVIICWQMKERMINFTKIWRLHWITISFHSKNNISFFLFLLINVHFSIEIVEYSRTVSNRNIRNHLTRHEAHVLTAQTFASPLTRNTM